MKKKAKKRAAVRKYRYDVHMVSPDGVAPDPIRAGLESSELIAFLAGPAVSPLGVVVRRSVPRWEEVYGQVLSALESAESEFLDTLYNAMEDLPGEAPLIEGVASEEIEDAIRDSLDEPAELFDRESLKACVQRICRLRGLD